MLSKSSLLFSVLLAVFLLLTCSDDKATSPSPSNTVTDIDGNVYPTVTIGSQVWMARNLKVMHYRNGDSIANIIADTAWSNLITGAYCNYNNDTAYATTYGRMYNWYAVKDNRNIAPAGWHVPTDAEWQTLIDYLGGSDVAGGKLKEAGFEHWITPNTGATNESGFSALPGGMRSASGAYGYIRVDGHFWSSTEFDAGLAWYRPMHAGSTIVTRNYGSVNFGFSVRCVRNN
jgi:uncharacterized protein (TIGR02145 family)